MQLTRTFTYAAPAGQVVAMLRYPGFWDRVAQQTGATSSTTTVTEIGDAVEVVTEQDQKVVGVPAFAKKFVGDTIHIQQREEWSSATDAKLDVSIPGKPGHLKGTITLRADGQFAKQLLQMLKHTIKVEGGARVVFEL